MLAGVFSSEISSPRRVRQRVFHWKEREESEVAVRHVLVLGAEQKPPHDWVVRVTEHHHYGTQHVILRPIRLWQYNVINISAVAN